MFRFRSWAPHFLLYKHMLFILYKDFILDVGSTPPLYVNSIGSAMQSDAGMKSTVCIPVSIIISVTITRADNQLWQHVFMIAWHDVAVQVHFIGQNL